MSSPSPSSGMRASSSPSEIRANVSAIASIRRCRRTARIQRDGGEQNDEGRPYEDTRRSDPDGLNFVITLADDEGVVVADIAGEQAVAGIAVEAEVAPSTSRAAAPWE